MAINQYLQSPTELVRSDELDYVERIIGDPVRVYPFKICTGFAYQSNRGMYDLGQDLGHPIVSETGVMKEHTPSGAYTDMTLLYSGNEPIIIYWFGVFYANIGPNGIKEWMNCYATKESVYTDQANGQKDNLFAPLTFTNPLTGRTENPWKEVGVIDKNVTTAPYKTENLDNVETAVYETNYEYTTISNTWYPTFQEMNEFVYFIIDKRYACPIALRISAVTPHISPDGKFQWCDIQFKSLNQYFNSSGRSILTYVRFGAPNDAYAFPYEQTINGKIHTYINPWLAFPKYGGVTSLCVKNNSLCAQMGTIVYGRPYVPFNVEVGSGYLVRLLGKERYLIPAKFEAPIEDEVVSHNTLIHTSYNMAFNMGFVNEELWSNWKNMKEIYNVVPSKFQFQGGLAFLGVQSDLVNNNSLMWKNIASVGTWLNNGGAMVVNEESSIVSNFPPWAQGWGSGNLSEVIRSNISKIPLDQLQAQQGGFVLPTGVSTFDFRFNKLVWGVLDFNENSPLIQLFDDGYYPDTSWSNEITSITRMAQSKLDGTYKNSYLPVTTAFTLMSMSMLPVHNLELSYRDGVIYTNQNRGHGGLLSMLENWCSSIADDLQGYTSGESKWFRNTMARSYNLMIPSSICYIAQQYLNPEGDNYNAIPLDIFDNTFQQQTATGQMMYQSGFQFQLTDMYYSTKQGVAYNTSGWKQLELIDGFTTYNTYYPQQPQANIQAGSVGGSGSVSQEGNIIIKHFIGKVEQTIRQKVQGFIYKLIGDAEKEIGEALGKIDKNFEIEWNNALSQPIVQNFINENVQKLINTIMGTIDGKISVLDSAIAPLLNAILGTHTDAGLVIKIAKDLLAGTTGLGWIKDILGLL